MSPLPQIKTFDPSQVTENYLATRAATRTGERQNVLAGQRDVAFQNVLADRERRLTTEDEDRIYEQRLNRIKEDDIWRKQGMDIAMQVDPDADDATFRDQVSKIPDALGARMSDLGYDPQDIQKTTQRFFRSGIWSKKGIKAMQEKAGLRKAAPKLTGAAANLEVILGRKPTVKEVKDFRAKKGKTGESEDIISRKYALEYAYEYGGATTPQEATSIADQLQGKTVAELEAVKEDKGYWSTLWAAITGAAPEEGAPQTTATTTRSTGMEIPRTTAGNEPVPQTQADFDALAPGTTYRDPDDNKLYRK